MSENHTVTVETIVAAWEQAEDGKMSDLDRAQVAADLIRGYFGTSDVEAMADLLFDRGLYGDSPEELAAMVLEEWT